MAKKIGWILIIVIFLVPLFMLKEAGNFLVINEKPEKSDVIIVLSGGEIERIEKAVDLYKKGYARYIMISNGKEDNLYAAMKQMGVPDRSIILENKATSTTDSAYFTTELMSQRQFQSAIVVSSDFHMRRVKSNYEKAPSKKEMKLLYCSVSDIGYDSHRWWTTKEYRRTTFIEYTKLVGNYFGYHGKDAKDRLNQVFSSNE